MANFLITSPSSETVGTNSNDLFDLQALQGNTVFGLEGNDTVTANITVAGSAALLNAGAGNDIFNVTGGLLYEGNIFAGSGNDSLTLGRDFSAAIVRGGSGDDTILLAANGSLDRTTVNGNDNADFISANISAGSNSSFVGGGKGKDTINLDFASGANAFTINGGLGHDSIVFSAVGAGNLFAFQVAGGDGFDTLRFGVTGSNNLSGSFNINGDALSDSLVFAGQVTTTEGSATIGGGAGADTIQFLSGASITQGFINAGAGLDSVFINDAFNAGTLNGGAGADSITLLTYAQSASNGGVIFGDLGSDVLSLGAASFNAVTGSYVIDGGSGGSVLGYASFDQSNLASFDNVSASVAIVRTGTTISGTVDANLFNVRQDVVDATIGSNLAVAQFTTNAGGAVTFTGTFSNTLTARALELDRVLAAGQTVAFSNGAGTSRYVFMQGGAAGSGTDNDLLIQVNSADLLIANSVSSVSVQTRTIV